MRNTLLTSIRPQLDLQESSKTSEAFQNTVLRPILKFQNPLTLTYIQSVKYFDSNYASLSKGKLQEHLSELLQNKTTRNQIIGMIIGLMTAKEFSIYAVNRKEYNKRILSMQIERYVDQLTKE